MYAQCAYNLRLGKQQSYPADTIRKMDFEEIQMKKSAFSTLKKSVFPMEDDGGPAGGYTLFVSVIQGPGSIYLESFRKWDVRDAEVNRFLFEGEVNKLVDWVGNLDAFDTESALAYMGLISRAKADTEERTEERFILSHRDLPVLAGD